MVKTTRGCSRRFLLTHGMLAGAGVGLLASAASLRTAAELLAGESPATLQPTLLAQLRRAHFAALLDEPFELRGADESVSIRATLVRVIDRKAPPDPVGAAPGRQPFSLLFRDDSKATRQRQTVRLSHPGLGNLDVLATPTTPPGMPYVLYEAVFA